jgi:hypothetical protein
MLQHVLGQFCEFSVQQFSVYQLVQDDFCMFFAEEAALW